MTPPWSRINDLVCARKHRLYRAPRDLCITASGITQSLASFVWILKGAEGLRKLERRGLGRSTRGLPLPPTCRLSGGYADVGVKTRSDFA